KRTKTCARKNATPSMDIFNDEGSDCEIFISDEAMRKFTDCISSRGLFFERGFAFDLKDKNLGYLQASFYSNLKPSNKKFVVMVRSFEVSYYEGTINMMFGIKKVDEEYHDILLMADESEYEVYMQSPCNPNTTWVEYGGEKY
ncbi:hypothetical protein RYX36_007794, partial [Vicia faba]